MNILVSNLGKQVTEESLNATFSTYGEVQSAIIIVDQFTGISSGFAYIEMSVEHNALIAIKKLNGAVVNGLELGVKEEQLAGA